MMERMRVQSFNFGLIRMLEPTAMIADSAAPRSLVPSVDRGLAFGTP